jgi:signal transduction histidine kinase
MSLRLRLMLLVAALVVLLLGGLGLYLGGSLEPWAIEALDHELEIRCGAIGAHLEITRDGELEEEDEGGEHGAFEVQDASGALLLGRGLERLRPLPAGIWGPRTVTASDGAAWRLSACAISPEHAGRLRAEQRPLRLIVGVPAQRFAPVSSRFQLGLGIALVLGLALGGLGAALIAQLSSAPLRRLSAELRTIEASSLDHRISLAGLDPELSRLGGAVNELLDRLSLAFQQQRALVSRASHALRTPVASLLSITEVSLRRERSAEDYRQALVEVAEVAADASVLVQQILALGRADIPRGTLSLGPVALAELGEELRRLFAARAAEAGIELSVDLAPSLVAWADRARLRELLEVLLDNALRYTPRGARVGLRAAAAVGDASAPAAGPAPPLAGPGLIDLEVWDTGPGFVAEERSKVFERFFRGKAAEHSGQAGTGLGLAIARAIADAHGAPLWIEERPGGGASVKLRLRTPGQ